MHTRVVVYDIMHTLVRVLSSSSNTVCTLGRRMRVQPVPDVAREGGKNRNEFLVSRVRLFYAY